MIVGFAGYATSGKDEAARPLIDRGFVRVAFADPLKALAKELGWSGRKDAEGRAFLEALGPGARKHIHPRVWVWAAEQRIKEVGLYGDVVVTDVRYHNEVEMIQSLGGHIYRVVRPGIEPAGPSDRALDEVDLEPIHNIGSKEDLHRKVLDEIRYVHAC